MVLGSFYSYTFFVFQSSEVNKTIMTVAVQPEMVVPLPKSFDPDPCDCSIQILIVENLCPPDDPSSRSQLLLEVFEMLNIYCASTFAMRPYQGLHS